MPWLDGIPHLELHPGGADHRRQAICLCKEKVDVNHLASGFADMAPNQSDLSRPLLSDLQRLTTRAYGVLYDDPGMAENPKQIPLQSSP
jgi:hypothetical protein